MKGYSYKCLDRQEWSNEDYGLKVISPDSIESIRLWRNMQMDVLRQTKKISKIEQEDYFNKYIWPDMFLEKPKNILLCFYFRDIFICQVCSLFYHIKNIGHIFREYCNLLIDACSFV